MTSISQQPPPISLHVIDTSWLKSSLIKCSSCGLSPINPIAIQFYKTASCQMWLSGNELWMSLSSYYYSEPLLYCICCLGPIPRGHYHKDFIDWHMRHPNIFASLEFSRGGLRMPAKQKSEGDEATAWENHIEVCVSKAEWDSLFFWNSN